MKKRAGLMFIGLCLVISAGLVLVNFNQASFKVMAANEKASKNASSFLSEGITYDLLAGSTTASISGNVKDKKRHAIKGVVVEVFEKGKTGKSVGKSTTDANGNYKVGGLKTVVNSTGKAKAGKYKIQIGGKTKADLKVKSTDIGETIIKNFKSKK